MGSKSSLPFVCVLDVVVQIVQGPSSDEGLIKVQDQRQPTSLQGFKGHMIRDSGKVKCQ